MLKDSFARGLIAAVNVVAFRGPIYIVLDITKFGLNVSLSKEMRSKALDYWKTSFMEACGRMLEVVTILEKYNYMVYIELKKRI